MLLFAPSFLLVHQARTKRRHRPFSIVARDRAILTVDVGTSATKSGLYFLETKTLGSVYRHPHRTETKNGLIMQRKQDWLDAMIATSSQALSGADDVEIIAVSLTGQMQDLIAVGDAPPLLAADAILYSANVPNHAARLSLLAKRALPATSIPAKLALLEPGNYRLLFGAADYLAFELSEENPIVTDATTVSTTSLTQSPHRAYDEHLLGAMKQHDFLHLFPEIIPSTRQVGSLSSEIASLLHPRLAGIPIIHAGGDAYTATIGAGRDYVYGGTSGWVGRVLSNTSKPPERVLTLAHARNADEVIAAGSVADVGGCLVHAGRILGCTPEEVGRLAQNGRNGVVYIPYLSGRRCPPGNATGAWIGLRGDDGRSEMARAVVEGVVYALYDAGGTLDVNDIVVVGGMVGCRKFKEGIAALFGGCCTGERDIGLVGAGLVAADALGVSLRDEQRGEWIKATGESSEGWRAGYEEWKNLVETLESKQESSRL